MHIDTCPYAIRLGRWVPALLPEVTIRDLHTTLSPQYHSQLCHEWSRIIESIAPNATSFEIRDPSYRHNYALDTWAWHHDTFMYDHDYMIVWTNLKPTLFRIGAIKATELTGIEPFDVVLAHKEKTEHCGPRAGLSEVRWFARAFVKKFNIEEYRAKNLVYPLLQDPALAPLPHSGVPVLSEEPDATHQV